MRSYGQFCAMARALDVVGDRWTLLIVRELWLRPQRFGTLSAALPGVASNLLTERLKALESAGVLDRSTSSTPVYSLTERGRALIPVMQELVRWGEPEMARGAGNDAYRNEWFALALEDLVPRDAVTARVMFALDFAEGGPAAVLLGEPGQGIRLLDAPVEAQSHPRIVGDPTDMIAALTGAGDLVGVQIDGSPQSSKAIRALLSRAVRLRAAPAGAPAG